MRGGERFRRELNGPDSADFGPAIMVWTPNLLSSALLAYPCMQFKNTLLVPDFLKYEGPEPEPPRAGHFDRRVHWHCQAGDPWLG